MPDLLTFDGRKQRAKFRAWHRGTREALLEEDDVDVMAWALKTAPTPPRFQGELMAAMQRLDYVDIPR